MAKQVMVRWQVTSVYQAEVAVDDATDVDAEVLAENETADNWVGTECRETLEVSESELPD